MIRRHLALARTLPVGNLSFMRLDNRRRVAVFGVTGLLGRDLLTELSTAWPNARIEVFARSNSGQSGQHRARLAADQVLRESQSTGRINFHTADLAHPGLLLDHYAMEALLSCDQIINAAADVSFGLPLGVARQRNVETVANLIDVVSSGRPTIHQVSTAYVNQSRETTTNKPGTTELGFRNTYEQSKAEAELLLADSELDWRIYRPSIIVGSSRDGKAASYDTVYVFARALSSGRMAAIPGDRRQVLDIVPSDYVARTIRRLIEVGEPRTIFHITAGRDRATSIGELADSFHDVLVTREHPAAEACDPNRLRMLAPSWFDNLLALPEGFAPARLKREAQMAETFLPFLRSDALAFDSTETWELLHERPPAFATYAGRIWHAALDDDFGVAGSSPKGQGRCPPPSTWEASLADTVRRAAQLRPNATALESADSTYTFQQLEASIDELEFKLRSLGLTSGTRVSIRCHHTPAVIILLLAALACEAEVHMLPPGDATTTDNVQFALSMGEDLEPYVQAAGAVDSGQPGIVLATSGTTGSPKWVHHGADSLPACGSAAARRITVRPRHKVALFLPIYHAYATCVVLPAAWSQGASVSLLPGVTNQLLHEISSVRATHVVGVMEHFQRLLDEVDDVDVDKIPEISWWEAALCGDDPILPAVWSDFERTFGRPLVQGYGLTECPLVGIGVEPHEASAGMVVRPLDGVTIQVRDEHGTRVGSGRVGEVWVGAPWQMTTSCGESSSDGSLVATGDHGYLDTEGNLHIVGRRMPTMRMSEGRPDMNPELPTTLELEDVLIRDCRVRRVHVLWSGSDAIGFVQLESGGTALPQYIEVLGVGVRVEIVDRLPRTPVGKVRRWSLEADFSNR